ncbi:hypothetical protein L4C54_23155 [Vibrio lamellibrachiae]|uniref:hypothetical protein n=1 Tax=Vibrio lamellibrachiae TaxID=2910253 RepID=UPI003D0BC894
MSQIVFILTSKQSSGISVKFLIDDKFQELTFTAEAVQAKKGMTDLESAEISVLLDLVDLKMFSPDSAVIFTENADAIEQYLDEALDGRLPLNMEAKYIDESIFIDKKKQLFLKPSVTDSSNSGTLKLKTKKDVPERILTSTLPVATTTLGLVTISDKAVSDACHIVKEIDSPEDLVKYLGSNTSEWTSKPRTNKGIERFMQCGNLAMLVSYETDKHMPPVIVYAFKGNEETVYSDADVEVSGKKIKFSADQWLALCSIAEVIDSSLLAEFSFKNIRSLMKNVDAFVENNLLVLPNLDLSLSIDEYGRIDSTDGCLTKLASENDVEWRKPVPTLFGEITLNKLPANKLANLWECNLGSPEFLTKFHEAMKGTISKHPFLSQKLEIEFGEYAMFVSLKENQFFITDIGMRSNQFSSINNRFGTFIVRRGTIMEADLQAVLTKQFEKEILRGDLVLLEDSDVSIKTSAKGHLDINEHKKYQLLYYPEMKLTIGLQRINESGLGPGSLLEVTFVDHEVPPLEFAYNDSKVTLRKKAETKIKAILEANQIEVNLSDYISELLGHEHRPHQAFEDVQEIVFGNYAIHIKLIDGHYEISDARVESKQFFWIQNSEFTYVLRRASKTERALYSAVLGDRNLKTYGKARTKLATSPATVIQGNKKRSTDGKRSVSVNYNDLGLEIRLGSDIDPVLGSEPIMAVIGFNKF